MELEHKIGFLFSFILFLFNPSLYHGKLQISILPSTYYKFHVKNWAATVQRNKVVHVPLPSAIAFGLVGKHLVLTIGIKAKSHVRLP